MDIKIKKILSRLQMSFGDILDKHPGIVALAMIVGAVWLLWFLSQPVELIYDPNGPPLHCRWYQDC